MKKTTLVRWSARLTLVGIVVGLVCLVYFFPRFTEMFACILFFLLVSLVVVNIVASALFCKRYVFNVLERETWKSQFEVRDELRRTKILYRLRILDSGNMYQALAALEDGGLVESRRCERYTVPQGHNHLTEYRLTEAGFRQRIR